ncbi:MAG: ABC transporter permease [Gammaproteobacteria bacterium]|nr:MAG: ABC transporter permease [Gammaproteobacteria bacterium]
MLWTVVGKELLDNARDRRTLASALLFGPLFGPLLFAVLISVVIQQTVSDVERPVSLPVIGAEHAPNLIAFLGRNGFEVERWEGDLAGAREAVQAGRQDVVLVIDPAFGERFQAGLPARVQLIQDASAQRAARNVNRARGALNAYSGQLRALRLQARGVSPEVLRPLVIDDVDVSTATGRAALLLGMITYFLLAAMLMGGLYLAIDATAGERERGSLEPLLTLPVTRSTLLLGKILATCCYMLLSLVITLVAFAIGLSFVSLEELGMSANFGPQVVLLGFLLMAPFVLLGAALMTLVASFTKTYKEAQTYVGVLIVVPTLPILFAAFLSVKPSALLMTVPSLSQHLLMTALIRNEPLDPGFAAISVVSTLALGGLVTWLATLFYRREGLMG